jgi:uncharacterized protein YkwD
MHTCNIIKRGDCRGLRNCLLVSFAMLLLLLSGCGNPKSGTSSPQATTTHGEMRYDNAGTTQELILSAHATPTPIPTPKAQKTPGGSQNYGPPPAMTALEHDLAQKLFALINQERTAKGLAAFTWNDTLALAARQHSWDMYHCGFSHYCPNGIPPCTRVQSYFPSQPVCTSSR